MKGILGWYIWIIKINIFLKNSVIFSPDGSKLASGGKDNTIKIWDCQTYKLVQTIKVNNDDKRDENVIIKINLLKFRIHYLKS